MQNELISPTAPLPYLNMPAPSDARYERNEDLLRDESYGCVDWYDYKRRSGDPFAVEAAQAHIAEPRG